MAVVKVCVEGAEGLLGLSVAILTTRTVASSGLRVGKRGNVWGEGEGNKS